MDTQPMSSDSNYHDVTTSMLSYAFGWMALGLFMTGITSFAVANTPRIFQLLMHGDSLSFLGFVVMFSPIAFVVVMSFGFNKLSFTGLVALYMVYSVIMGASLSFIFFAFTTESITATLISTGAMFGVMAFLGFSMRKDLSKIGNILLMGLVGVIIVSVTNIFLKSDALSVAISVVTIILFCGLTAVDVQKLKNIPSENADESMLLKLGIMGALTLYLDFINIFVSMLRFTGKRRR